MFYVTMLNIIVIVSQSLFKATIPLGIVSGGRARSSIPTLLRIRIRRASMLLYFDLLGDVEMRGLVQLRI